MKSSGKTHASASRRRSRQSNAILKIETSPERVLAELAALAHGNRVAVMGCQTVEDFERLPLETDEALLKLLHEGRQRVAQRKRERDASGEHGESAARASARSGGTDRA